MNFKFTRGFRAFTLIETVVTLGILGVIMLAVGIFQANIFGYHGSLAGQLTGQHEARRALEEITARLRAAQHGGNGSYPIEAASAASLIFFTNADADAGIERVRYFTSGSTLQRGIIEPSGSNPVAYSGPETVATIVNNMANGATPVFMYYDDSYAGTGTPLSEPIPINDVRYVHITFLIDKDANRPPLPLRIEGGMSVRNVKDNL